MAKFKVGDKVKCLVSSTPYFTKGKIYTVLSTDKYYEGNVRVELNDKGAEDGWDEYYFELYEEAEVEEDKAVVKENLTTEAEDVKHNHYYVDLSKYIKDGKCIVDVYKILAAYKVVHPELQHLGKKVLCLGQRGLKDELTDAENILDSAESFVERLKLEIAYANKGGSCDGK